MNTELAWDVIDKYFEDNPNILVNHHLASYNDFIKNGIRRIFKEKNPIVLQKKKIQKPIFLGFAANCISVAKVATKYTTENRLYMMTITMVLTSVHILCIPMKRVCAI